MKALFSIVIGGVTMAASLMAGAVTKTTTIKWYAGMNAGITAGVCSSSIPDNKPLQIPRTLVIDNHLPVGSTLFSWDFDTFLPGYQVHCNGYNTLNLDKRTTRSDNPGVIYNSEIQESLVIGFSGAIPLSANIFKTSIDGIGVKFYIRSDHDPISNSGVTVVNSHGFNPPVINMPKDIIYQMGSGISNLSDSYIRFYRMGSFYYLPNATLKAGVSIKAELIKTGDITSYGSLSILGSPKIYSNNSSWPTDSLTGNAINVVAPACRLKKQHYSIDMGSIDGSYQGTHVHGNNEPVRINLECSGQVDNVQFRFADAGSSPSSLANKNITLYNISGGKIEGLEIEMRYNGSRINIDGSTLTSTGSYGTTKIDPSSSPVYDSTGEVNFTANYVQTGPISYGGSSYVGNVTGKVNMWVTYN